jgi:hypothetical protein
VLGFARLARLVLVAAAAGALVLAGGCSASNGRADKPASSPHATSSPSARPSPTAVRAASRSALAAYDGMWKEMQAAGVTANWRDPGLAKYASGSALATLVNGLHNDHNAGLQPGQVGERRVQVSSRPRRGSHVHGEFSP